MRGAFVGVPLQFQTDALRSLRPAVGANSLPAVKELVEKSDLVLSVGGLESDFNSGSFSYSLETNNIVELHSDHTKVGFATFPSLSFRELLPSVPRMLLPVRKRVIESDA